MTLLAYNNKVKFEISLFRKVSKYHLRSFGDSFLDEKTSFPNDFLYIILLFFLNINFILLYFYEKLFEKCYKFNY